MEEKKDTTLKIYFCNLLDKSYSKTFFDELIINGISVSTESNVELPVDFTELESFLGKKVCSFELIRHKKNEINELKISGLFQIYEGLNIAFCFIDVIGVTLELIFLSENKLINEFINTNFEISASSTLINHKMEISLNALDTENRANILLINCPKNSIIKNNNGLNLSISQLISSINDFSDSDCYQFCFSTIDDEQYCFKKIEPIEELKFDKIYNDYYQKVNKLYNELTNNNENKISLESEKERAKEMNELLNKIISRKYIYPTEYLAKQLNKEIYIDFILKAVFISYVKDVNENIISTDIKDLHKKLLENEDNIRKDNRLERYEKILLLIYLYLSKILKEEEYIIQYYYIKDSEENSPLNLCFKFLYEFADKFSNNSNFFYPLLCIDSGLFKHKLKRKPYDDSYEYIDAFGFDMCSVEKIRNHLKDMIPNIIIKDTNLEEEAETFAQIGLITLNITENLKDINKRGNDIRVNKHFAFILSKILFHEIFGHKKSALCKNSGIFSSAKCFKDKNNQIRFVSDSYDQNQFQLFENIEFSNENDLKNKMGECGYFLEFFLGNIYGIAVFELIDKIQNKTNLRNLLNVDLYHNDIKAINEFVKYKYYIVNKNLEKKDEKSSNIYEEIENMKKIIKSQDKALLDIEDTIKEFFKEKFDSKELIPFNKEFYSSEENANNNSALNKKGRKSPFSNKMKINKKFDFCYKKIIDDFANQTMTFEEYNAAYPFLRYKIISKK